MTSASPALKQHREHRPVAEEDADRRAARHASRRRSSRCRPAVYQAMSLRPCPSADVPVKNASRWKAGCSRRSSSTASRTRGARGRAAAAAVPVDPRDLVVLAVGVVVAALACGRTRRRPAASACPARAAASPAGCACCRCAQRERPPGRRSALDAAVPAAVVGGAVAVVLAVGLVVLVVVADRSASVKPSWAVTKLMLARGRRPRAAEEVARAGERATRVAPSRAARRRARSGARVSRKRSFHSRPAGREAADLVAAGADVPGLGDQLDVRQHRVLRERVEEAARRGRSRRPSRAERRREVEAEAVDVHLLDPVAQRVHDHLQHARMAQVRGCCRSR